MHMHMYVSVYVGNHVMKTMLAVLPNDVIASILSLNHDPVTEIRIYCEYVMSLNNTQDATQKRP